MKILNGLSMQNENKDRWIIKKIKDNKLLIICVTLYLLSAVFFNSNFLYNWDAGQFALGTERYSLSEHQPHPPGYFLFIYSGKALNYVINNINTSFVFINIVAGLFIIIFIYRFLYLISFDQKISFWGTILFTVNPIFWFYHSVALTYTFESLITVLLSYLTYKQFKNNVSALPLSTFLTAIIAGFRPSIVIIALPFLVIQLLYSKRKFKNVLLSILAGITGAIIWFPLFVKQAGGITTIYNFVISQLSVAKEITVYNINQKLFLFQSIIYSLHLPLALLFLFSRKIWDFIKNQSLVFIVIAIFWQLGVYILLHFGEVGYLLSIIPLFYILLAPAIKKMVAQNVIIRSFLILLVLLEFLTFLFGVPFINNHKLKQLTFIDIRTHDRRIKNFINFLDKYNPEDTLVIILRGQYLNSAGGVSSYPYDDIRLLSYYLPDYKLYDLLGVRNIYFIAEQYKYTQHNESLIVVPQEIKNIIFLADYIHPAMKPSNINLNALYEKPSTENIYWGSFEQDEFEYNGMDFQKTRNFGNIERIKLKGG